MRSGLKFSEVYSDLGSDVIEMLFNRADAAAYAAGQPLIAAPGTMWSYSSGTTNILSRSCAALLAKPTTSVGRAGCCSIRSGWRRR